MGAERSAEGAVLACGVCCGGAGGWGRLGRRVKAKEGAEKRRKCDLRVFLSPKPFHRPLRGAKIRSVRPPAHAAASEVK